MIYCSRSNGVIYVFRQGLQYQLMRLHEANFFPISSLKKLFTHKFATAVKKNLHKVHNLPDFP